MATPQWVRFSEVGRPIDQVLKNDLADAFSLYNFKLWVINELGFKPETGTLGDIDAPFIECDEVDRALTISRGWKGVALTYVVKSIGHNVTLNLWHDAGSTKLCLYLAREIVWYKKGRYEEGEWLLELLLHLISALKTDCCGYGRDADYETIYAPLSPQKVLSRLRDGSLLHIPDPVIHLISTQLVTAAVIDSLVREHGSAYGFQRRESSAGFHMLWNI